MEERRGCVIINPYGEELVMSAKAFDIPKKLVWDAYLDVKKSGGGPGIDGQSMEDFETDLKNNLYKIWNRLSSGSYFPPPVLRVEIPKADGGVREMISDRVAAIPGAVSGTDFHPLMVIVRAARPWMLRLASGVGVMTGC